jgi:hypothetical protein
MRGLALILVLLSAGAAGAAWYTQAGGEWESATAMLQREHERGQILEAQLYQRQRFADFCDQQMFQVLIGASRLVHACRQIESYAAIHYPGYLEQLDMLRPGRSLREKVAHNIAESFSFRQTERGAWERDPHLTLRLVVEIQEAIDTP